MRDLFNNTEGYRTPPAQNRLNMELQELQQEARYNIASDLYSNAGHGSRRFKPLVWRIP
jgi:pyridoxine 5'-phosphate synthase PdxJ